MNILVTGSSGQLGEEFKTISSQSEHDFSFKNKESFNITKFENINSYLQNNKVNIIINCAAYTAVDKAETE